MVWSCGVVPYFRGELCCAGKPMKAADGQRCCIHNLYTPENQICCGGFVFNVTKNTTQCCNSKETYDSTKERCCAGVRRKIVNADQATCCGTKLIKGAENICCGGKAYSKVKADTCCGNKPYLSNTHHCCLGFVVKRQGTTANACCDRKAMEISSQICCCGQVLNKASKVIFTDNHDKSASRIVCVIS